MGPSTFTPQRLAKDLGLPPPTAEQAAVIGAPAAPLLVVAGAGSGKTETMAARVVYLVANGVVRPEQVLGLTFTRKAAGELAQRVRTRLHALAAKHPQLADVLAGEPTVATYHAYAGRVLAEHGLRGGYEAGVRLLTEAARWQLADAVVRAYDGDMSQVANGVDWVTEAVLALAADLSEHLREPAEVADWTERLITDIAAIPPVARQPGPYADTHKVIAVQEARRQLLPLVEQYVARKHAADAIDFG